jgi:hypothetical protein
MSTQMLEMPKRDKIEQRILKALDRELTKADAGDAKAARKAEGWKAVLRWRKANRAPGSPS